MTVYLIHFTDKIGGKSPRGKAQHYIGYTTDILARQRLHLNGQGAAIMRALRFKHVGWSIIRTWEGDRALERRLKNMKNSPRLCPVCNPYHWQNHGNYDLEEAQ